MVVSCYGTGGSIKGQYEFFYFIRIFIHKYKLLACVCVHTHTSNYLT